MRKIRVLFVVPTSSNTGGPRVLLNLLSKLERSSFDPLVLLFDSGPLVEELDKIGAPYIIDRPGKPLKLDRLRDSSFSKKLSTLYAHFLLAIRVRTLIRKQGIDIVWARNLKSVALVGFAAKATRTPLIWDIGLEKPGVGFFKFLHAFGLLVSTQVVTEADRQHDQIFGETLAHRYAHKIRTINPGISRERIEEIHSAKVDKKINTLRKSADLNILQVGTLCERKNQLLSIKALERLKGVSVSLHLVGSAETVNYENLVRISISENDLENQVFVYGWSEEIPDFLAAADLFLMTSLNEGIPYGVHEAMHAGLPVIVSDAGGMPDAVEPDLTGKVTKVDDLDQLVNAITYFIENPNMLETMGAAGRQRAITHFSSETWYENYSRLIKDLARPLLRRNW